jgi:hypothetical protein
MDTTHHSPASAKILIGANCDRTCVYLRRPQVSVVTHMCICSSTIVSESASLMKYAPLVADAWTGVRSDTTVATKGLSVVRGRLAAPFRRHRNQLARPQRPFVLPLTSARESGHPQTFPSQHTVNRSIRIQQLEGSTDKPITKTKSKSMT